MRERDVKSIIEFSGFGLLWVTDGDTVLQEV